jgi:hypothetical protein
MSFTEREWKALRRIEPVALDRYCTRVLEECASLLEHAEGTAHERYHELFRLLKKRDRELAEAFDDMRRSRAVARLAAMRRLGVVSDEEMEAFSPATRDTIAMLMEAWVTGLRA